MNDYSRAIQLTDVTVTRNELVMLDHVSLTIRRGEFSAIIGPNGAGKTTLLRVVLGLMKPDSGTVEIFETPIAQLGPKRAKIGYVPQIFDIDLNFPITVFELALMGTYGSLGTIKRPTARERESAMAAIRKMEIADLVDRPIGRLSGGQRQRAFLARALATNPELLLLDEPTTGVDIEAAGSLYSLLRELRESEVTVVLVSHDIGVVASYVDRLACLNRSLVAHCKPDEVECSNALTQMYGCHVAYLHHGEAPHIVVEEHK